MAEILIIEGTRPLRDAIADVLREANFSTITADNGIEGVERAHEHAPDLILCDADIQHLDGYGVFVELQKSPETAHIPFLLMTSSADSSKYPLAVAPKVDHLYKPFSVTHLVHVVQTRLSRTH